MAQERSVAEERGHPFKTRCDSALTILKIRWKLIQTFSTESVRFRQEQMRKRDPMLARLEDEVTRRDMTGLIKHLADKDAKEDEDSLKAMWEEGLQFTREAFGSDAVDFALKAMEKERAVN